MPLRQYVVLPTRIVSPLSTSNYASLSAATVSTPIVKANANITARNAALAVEVMLEKVNDRIFVSSSKSANPYKFKKNRLEFVWSLCIVGD